jgi:hypothetical protein
MVQLTHPYEILAGKPDGRGHPEVLGVDRKMILWILGTLDGKVWTGCIWLLQTW